MTLITENKETFNQRLGYYFAPSDQLDLKLAYTLAKFGHRAQFRKELLNGKPLRYFEHVRRTSLILIDEVKIINKDMIIAALLHDSFEDTQDLTPELIEHCFGTHVVSMIRILSKVPKEGYLNRLKNCIEWESLVIKGCDKLDNLRSLMVPGTTMLFQQKQIDEIKKEYYPLFDRLIEICPSKYKLNVVWLRDEIHKMTERASVIMELNEEIKTQNLSGTHLTTL